MARIYLRYYIMKAKSNGEILPKGVLFQNGFVQPKDFATLFFKDVDCFSYLC